MSARTIALLALLTACALIAGLLESYFPLPFPGMRLGIANIFSLVALTLFGPIAAIAVACARAMLSFLITGNFFALVCSGAGMLCSLPTAIFLYKNFKRTVSVPAISVASASAFNFGQVGAVMLMTGEPRIALYLPVLMLLSFFTGYAVGVLAESLSARLNRLTTH